ncbi:MAG: hypothetical protein ACI4QJ_06725 [Candidatus Spyradenecus sp.]
MATYPLAVWTATHGLDWTFPRGEIDFATLERCRKAFGPMPDFDSGDPGFEGVWVTAERVFAVRCQSVKGWDFRGRDATYLAVTWMSRAEAVRTNFEALLAVRELREPMRQVPPFFSASIGGPMPVGGPLGACAQLEDFRGVGPIVATLLPSETAMLRRALGEKRVTLRRIQPSIEMPATFEPRPLSPPPRAPLPPTSPSAPPPATPSLPWPLIAFAALLMALLLIQSWRLIQAQQRIQALEVAKQCLEVEQRAQGLSPAETLIRSAPMAPFVKRQSSSQPLEQEKSHE